MLVSSKLLRNTQIQCTPPHTPPHLHLRADLQQIDSKLSKAYLFAHRQAGPALNTLGASCCVSGPPWQHPCRRRLLPPALLTPGERDVGGQHPRTPPRRPRRPWRRPSPPCSLRPRLPSYPLVGTAQTLCRPQGLGVEVFAIQDVDRFGDLQNQCQSKVQFHALGQEKKGGA